MNKNTPTTTTTTTAATAATTTTINNNNNNHNNNDVCVSENGDKLTNCWPRDWLAADQSDLRILSVDYDTQLTHWMSNNRFERKTLKEQSLLLLDSLVRAGVGARPFVLVGHSMGGLIAKQMLIEANERNYKDFVDNISGLVFFSVPHKGSSLATYSRSASYILHPTDEILQLVEGSGLLEDMHNKFTQLVVSRQIKLLSFTEGEVTNLPFKMKAKIVSEVSSDPGLGEFYIMKDLNHINICKPASKKSQIYIRTREFIRSCAYKDKAI
ncbi:hypothetical protein HELRODRAFT_95781 [Helobdella robusta]|uniref:GPI inositol-deacylase n=1 Tax=Helobdella robusta TaxID=6412 RepID=T1G975_HELRO|nr:hypothetical protein HELRODRAFT_95781 [Helobdella robusta]ESN94634.1 hypothetical protein HELRODRAFT_95781 [Helobdella robusta]